MFIKDLFPKVWDDVKDFKERGKFKKTFHIAYTYSE